MLCTLAVPPNSSYVETSIVAVPEGLALPTGTCAASRTLAMFNGLARRPATLGSLGGSVTGANATGIPGDMMEFTSRWIRISEESRERAAWRRRA
jgi:hypothetical protein